MFIEKLTNEKIEEFVKLLGFKKIIELRRYLGNYWIKPDLGIACDTVIFMSDFECIITGDYKCESKTAKFAKFMAQNFGERYIEKYHETVKAKIIDKNNLRVEKDPDYHQKKLKEWRL